MIRFIFFLAMLSIMCSCVSTTEPERPIRTQDSLAILDTLPDTLFLHSVQAIHTRDSFFQAKHRSFPFTDTLVLKPKFSPTTYRYTVKGCSWALRPYYPRLSKSMVIYDSSYSTEEATAAYMKLPEEPAIPDWLLSHFEELLKLSAGQDTTFFQLPDPYTLQLWMIDEPDTSYWAFIKDLSTDSLTGPPLYCESCPCSVSLTTYNQLQMQPVTYTFSTPKS